MLPSEEDDATNSGGRCYRGCRRCYQPHRVLLPAARGVAASGGWCLLQATKRGWWCCRWRTVMLPSASRDATSGVVVLLQAAMLPAADGHATGAGRTCCHRRAGMLPSEAAVLLAGVPMLPAVLLGGVPMLPAELSFLREGEEGSWRCGASEEKRGRRRLVYVFYRAKGHVGHARPGASEARIPRGMQSIRLLRSHSFGVAFAPNN